jgi:hypothetical protein
MDLGPPDYVNLIEETEKLLLAFSKSNQAARKKFPKGQFPSSVEAQE